MSEWMKEAIQELITEYKLQPNLYNTKHSLYYNKKARNQSLSRIATAVSKYRPNTSCEEVHKKIQTLRTQLGQEINKIEKSREHKNDLLVYSPKIWWYSKFEWIAGYMKGRSDPSTPLAVKLEKSQKCNESINEDEMIEDERAMIQIEEADFDTPPPPTKRPRKLNSDSKQQPSTTIEYIISNEDTGEIISPQEGDFLEIQPHNSNVNENNFDRCKKRSKNFGKYVAALMQDIRDDKTFFETQDEILNVIKQALLKK